MGQAITVIVFLHNWHRSQLIQLIHKKVQTRVPQKRNQGCQ